MAFHTHAAVCTGCVGSVARPAVSPVSFGRPSRRHSWLFALSPHDHTIPLHSAARASLQRSLFKPEEALRTLWLPTSPMRCRLHKTFFQVYAKSQQEQHDCCGSQAYEVHGSIGADGSTPTLRKVCEASTSESPAGRACSAMLMMLATDGLPVSLERPVPSGLVVAF